MSKKEYGDFELWLDWRIKEAPFINKSIAYILPDGTHAKDIHGKEMKLAVALETAPDIPRDEIVIKSRSPFLGATVANLSPALADELRLDASAEGVVITAIADGSAAETLGFQRGDLIVAVNNQRIAKTRDLERVTRDASRQWRITIERGVLNGWAIARFLVVQPQVADVSVCHWR